MASTTRSRCYFGSALLGGFSYVFLCVNIGAYLINLICTAIDLCTVGVFFYKITKSEVYDR